MTPIEQASINLTEINARLSIVLLRRALRELLEAIDYIEDMTFTRDIEPYKSEAIWDAAVENAKKALKDTA